MELSKIKKIARDEETAPEKTVFLLWELRVAEQLPPKLFGVTENKKVAKRWATFRTWNYSEEVRVSDKDSYILEHLY